MSFFRRRDERLQEMLEQSARNAARAGTLLREMLEDYPERSSLARTSRRDTVTAA